MKYILNAAMIPSDGTFSYRTISESDAVEWLRCNRDAQSYVGYEQTADYLSVIGGANVYMHRAQVSMVVGDEALVCRLRSRVPDPVTKGQAQPSEYGFGILVMTSRSSDFHCVTCANSCGELCGDGPLHVHEAFAGPLRVSHVARRNTEGQGA